MRTHVQLLDARLDAVEKLNVCYRLGKHPSETLWADLEKTEKALKSFIAQKIEPKDETEYISAIDMTTAPDETHYRKVSLGYNSKHPNTLELLGNLSHCTEITFDKKNAQKLINWLEYLKSNI